MLRTFVSAFLVLTNSGPFGLHYLYSYSIVVQSAGEKDKVHDSGHWLP